MQIPLKYSLYLQSLKQSVLKNRKTIIVLSVFLGLSVLIVSGAFYIKSYKTKSTKSYSDINSTQPAFSPYQPTVAQLLNQDIKIVFEKTKYPEIISLSDSALNEKDANKEYTIYVQVFRETLKAYNQTNNPKLRELMYEIKNYLLINPRYKKEDFNFI